MRVEISKELLFCRVLKLTFHCFNPVSLWALLHASLRRFCF